jgi:nitroreductase
VTDKPDLVCEVATIPMGTVGYAQHIPCFVVIVGTQGNYSSECDRRLIYIDGSLAVMSFIFEPECQAVSTCCVNSPEIVERDVEMAKFLNLEPDERPVMCLAVGYPDLQGMVAQSANKTLNVIRRYNFE